MGNALSCRSGKNGREDGTKQSAKATWDLIGPAASDAKEDSQGKSSKTGTSQQSSSSSQSEILDASSCTSSLSIKDVVQQLGLKVQENGALWALKIWELDVSHATGEAIVSDMFEASGYHWVLKLYPNWGHRKRGSVSLCLSDDPYAALDVGETTVKLTFISSDAEIFSPEAKEFRFQHGSTECMLPWSLSHCADKEESSSSNKKAIRLQIRAEIQVARLPGASSKAKSICKRMACDPATGALFDRSGTEHLFMEVRVLRHKDIRSLSEERRPRYGLADPEKVEAAKGIYTVNIKKFSRFKKFREQVTEETGISEACQLWLGFTSSYRSPESAYSPAVILGEAFDNVPIWHLCDRHLISKQWTMTLDLMLVECSNDLQITRSYNLPSMFQSHVLLLFWKRYDYNKSKPYTHWPKYIRYTAVPAKMRLGAAYQFLLAEAKRADGIELPQKPNALWIEEAGTHIDESMKSPLDLTRDCQSQGLRTGAIIVVK